MKEENLTVPIKRIKKYSSYKGEITPEVDNIINRDFHAERPNTKWLTDITEFAIPAGKVYLSPIIDCFDGMVVNGISRTLQILSWSTKCSKMLLAYWHHMNILLYIRIEGAIIDGPDG